MGVTSRIGINRRAVLTGTVAAATLAGTGVSVTAQTTPRTFVCLSAAWCGGWIWGRVADRLRARGHRVYTPTFTGLGERAHLLGAGVNMDTHIADAVGVLRWEDLRDVVLVAHSYGGIVGAGVIERALSQIASAIFVDAFMPANGDSLMMSASPRFRDMIRAASDRKEIAVAPVPGSVFAVNEKDRAWYDSRTTPHPLAAFRQPVTLTGARGKVARKAYIRAAAYDQPSFQAYYEDRRKDPAWRTATVPGGHCPMLDAPEKLAELMEAFA